MIERLKIIPYIDRKEFIDLTPSPLIRSVVFKHFCPAIGAAEVAFVRQDEVIVQKNPIIM
jgi:hypothetical protein